MFLQGDNLNTIAGESVVFGNNPESDEDEPEAFFESQAVEGEPESPSTEEEPPGHDLDAFEDHMEDDSILDHYDESFINDTNATYVDGPGRIVIDDTFNGVDDSEEEEYEEMNTTIHEPRGRGLTLRQLRALPRTTPTEGQRRSGSKSYSLSCI